MTSLSTSYAMYFNRIHEHFGPVFQNRFKSILVENDAYFMKLSQYIYLNPVKAKLIINPLDYKYSSIKEALGKEPILVLDQDIIRLIGETKGSQQAYEKFIYNGISSDLSEIERLFEKEEAVLGSEKFSTRSQKKYIRRKNKNYA